MRVKRVAVVGAGWSGAAAARRLHDGGVAVEVFEATAVVGGHSRAERLRGVLYEPNGPHVFHTSEARVAEFVHRFGPVRPYAHRPLTLVRVDGEPRHFSWPLQLGELSTLPQWSRIRAELAARPPVPATSNFETYCVSLMGETLYRLFVYHYTVKQWGVPPRTLAAEIGARRVHLREDGDGRLLPGCVGVLLARRREPGDRGGARRHPGPPGGGGAPRRSRRARRFGGSTPRSSRRRSTRSPARRRRSRGAGSGSRPATATPTGRTEP